METKVRRVFTPEQKFEIYLVGNDEDEQSAREGIGRYVDYYKTDRPHQSLMNFTPAYVHEVNNKTTLLNKLRAMKKETRQRRKNTGNS